MTANLAFRGIQLGAKHIPDKAFEKIPYAGPRYFQPKDRGSDGGDSNSQQSDSASEWDHSDEERGRVRRSEQRRRRRERRDRNRDERHLHDRGYESDRGPLGVDRDVSPYIPPPPPGPPPMQGQAVGGAPVPPGGGAPFIAKPYNPAEYGARPGSRDAYYAGHPQERQPSFTQTPPQMNFPPPPQNEYSDHQSSVADRYRPAGYPVPHESQYSRDASPRSRTDSPYGRSPNRHYPSALVVQHPPPGTLYPEYSPPEWDDNYDNRDDYDEKKRRGSQERPRHIRTRSKMREEVSKHKDLASTSFGALAGSIIGNQITSRKGHSSTIGLLGGAVIGGLAGNLIEKGYEKEKKKKREEKQRNRYRDGYDSY